MKCPVCKAVDLVLNESLSGIIWNRKKLIIHYCVNCGFESRKEFKLNEDSYQMELNRKRRQEVVNE